MIISDNEDDFLAQFLELEVLPEASDLVFCKISLIYFRINLMSGLCDNFDRFVEKGGGGRDGRGGGGGGAKYEKVFLQMKFRSRRRRRKRKGKRSIVRSQ